jgi:hypothetical protein
VWISFLEKVCLELSGGGDFSQRRCFAKENVAGLGMRVKLENAVAFLQRKVGCRC